MRPLAAALAAILLAVGPTLARELTDGVWVAEAGAETFVWELTASADGLGGVIHTLRDGRKETELPIDAVEWSPPDLVLHMHATGTRYRGTVDLEEGLVQGHVEHGDEQGPAMELQWRDPADLAGLRARPGNAPATYRQPEALGDGLVTADAADVGITHADIEQVIDAVVAGQAGVLHALLVVKDGRLVVEEYFHGYGRDDLHRLASVTKSVSSLLVGLAMDRGVIAGVDAPLLPFFPDLQPGDDPRWRDQTLDHLLTMSMGLDWGDADPHGTGPAFFGHVLQRPITHDPGSHWAYQSANVNLLSGVLKQATGRDADALITDWLLTPLGIDRHDWSYMATDGHRLMDGSLQLRPRDLLKLGVLLRDQGRWQGRPVVSASWIESSIAPRIQTDGREQYGYLWWVGRMPTAGGSHPVVFANGRGSQFLVWAPDVDLIVVTTGGNEDNGKHFAVLELLGRLI